MFYSDYTIGCDAHKQFSLFLGVDTNGELLQRTRGGHVPGAIGAFLSQFPEGTPVALETVGNWYWIVDEIEETGCVPQLAHAAKAKVMMGNVHKTDKLDAQGLATLPYLGKLPSVWIPPAEVRDERELPRTRMTFAKHRTMVKSRIHSTLSKYALSLDTASDIFAPKWRPELEATLQQLPDETGRCVLQQLEILDALNDHIKQLEDRILDRIQTTPTIQPVQTVPGPAKVLAVVIDCEVGSLDRFSAAKHFTSYCGLVPKPSASAGRAHFGHMVKHCNTYLKWAFIEAANVIVAHRGHPNWRRKYVAHRYESTRRRKGHSVAVVYQLLVCLLRLGFLGNVHPFFRSISVRKPNGLRLPLVGGTQSRLGSRIPPRRRELSRNAATPCCPLHAVLVGSC